MFGERLRREEARAQIIEDLELIEKEMRVAIYSFKRGSMSFEQAHDCLWRQRYALTNTVSVILKEDLWFDTEVKNTLRKTRTADEGLGNILSNQTPF